jgi:uncharacterized protein DUF1761
MSCRGDGLGLYVSGDTLWTEDPMPSLNYLAIAVAGIAGVVTASLYYILFSRQLQRLSPAARAGAGTRPPAWQIAAELLKHLLIAAVVAGFLAMSGIADGPGAATAALALWAGFPVTLLLGSVVHEGTSWRLAVLHGGDWLVKLQVIAAVTGIWR